jgi:hypothetical protein
MPKMLRRAVAHIIVLSTCLLGIAHGQGISLLSSGRINSFTSVNHLPDNDGLCTQSFPAFTPMQGMERTFLIRPGRDVPAVVLFQATNWIACNGCSAEVILEVDGVNQSFSANRILFSQDPEGSIAAGSSHGFNFGTTQLRPGRHTARILWRVGGPNPTNEVCAFHRDLTILHR